MKKSSLLIAFLIIVGLIYFGFPYYNLFKAKNLDNLDFKGSEISLEIDNDILFKDLGEYLKQEGIIKDDDAFNLLVNYKKGYSHSTLTKGKITINCESNAHGVSIQSPAHSSAATYTLTLPTTDGNANELLKTDGGGVLSWAVDSGGGPSLGTDHIIRTNALTISSPITFAGTENGVTYGPITATALVTVTSPSVWHIL